MSGLVTPDILLGIPPRTRKRTRGRPRGTAPRRSTALPEGRAPRKGPGPSPSIAPNTKVEIPLKAEDKLIFGPVYMYLHELSNTQKAILIRRIPPAVKDWVAQEEGYKTWREGMYSIRKNELEERLLEVVCFQTENVVVRL